MPSPQQRGRGLLTILQAILRQSFQGPLGRRTTTADELTEPLGVQTVSVLPQISDDELREMQAEDTDLGPVVDWIENGQSPTADVVRQHSLDTQNLWGQVPTVHLLNGVLVRKLPDQLHRAATTSSLPV